MTLYTMEPSRPHRPVRSYVRREGRMTSAQTRALTELWPLYGIDKSAELLDLERLFGRQASMIMELGFGNGETLVELAAGAPNCNFLGVEVYRPGVGYLLKSLRELSLTNVRVFCDDAIEVLTNRIPLQSLAKLLIFFPDPWPKKRHHKRRLIQPEFLRLAAERLEIGGSLHIATDWEDYALHVLEVSASESALRNMAGEKRFTPRPSYRPMTKFERRGQTLGHGVWDMLFERVTI